MKFTGIIASLAVASTASAAVVPVTLVRSSLTRLDGVLGNVETVVGGLVGGVVSGVTSVVGGSVKQVDLESVQTELKTIHTDLSGLLGDNVCNVAGVADVSSLATTVVSTATSVISITGITGEVSSLEALAGGLLKGVNSGDIDAAGLTSILQVVGMNNGLQNLNTVITKAQ